MTPRQKKRITRASAKGLPLVFIRRRALEARFGDALSRFFQDSFSGQKRAIEAAREHMVRELAEMVLRPIVSRLVRSVAGALS